MLKLTLFHTIFLVLSITSLIGQRASSISPFLIGDTLSFSGTLRDPSNKEVVLDELLEEKRSVLIFYRGGWCPYCNKHLSDMASIEEQILSLGFQLIAITPDSPKHLEATAEDKKLNYTLLSDANSELIRFLGIAVPTPNRYRSFLGKRFQEWIPTPSVYILNKEKIIRFSHINPNYKERLSSKTLLAILEELGRDG